MTETKMAAGKTTVRKTVMGAFLGILFVCCNVTTPARSAWAQEGPDTPKAQQSSKDQGASDQGAKEKAGVEKPASPAGEAAPAEHQPTSIGGELAKETREAEGEDEEHADLKHSTMVQKLAHLLHISVHSAHLVALIANFVIIAWLLIWALGKTVPGVMRGRNESIQHALEEARKASQEASKRLSDIENRLRQLDVEIGQMQVAAEKEAESEEGRIKKAAEDDMQKVVEGAKQEIDAAAKQVRRELSAHTADLALALARKQINVDTSTDQVLVRNFAAKLAEPGDPQKRNGGKGGH
jgi:F-type H+-transporting ATPase subunit b